MSDLRSFESHDEKHASGSWSGEYSDAIRRNSGSVIGLLHDYLLVRGGAEQFAVHVTRRFRGVECTCGFIDHEALHGEDLAGFECRELTSSSRIQGWQGLKALLAFQKHCGFIRDYEAVIYSGMYSPLAVNHRLSRRNIFYCHTPPRFVYDLRDYYFSNALPLQKLALAALIRYYRPRYEQAIRQMDVVIANSSNVRERLERYLGISNVQVIHPPVYTDRFRWLEQADYFLSTARLEPYKRVELVVRAFMQMPQKKLVVASGGSQLEYLQELAAKHDNIRFTGWCAASALQDLVGRCLATVYIPVDEDWGMSPIESMAAGKPVIGAAEGGLRESILQGETGHLIDLRHEGVHSADSQPYAVEKLITAVESLDSATALRMRHACTERAGLFSDKVFDQKFADLLDLQDR